jgi:LacI family transcriptional regulator
LLLPSTREFDRGLRRGFMEYARSHGPWTIYEDPPGYLAALTLNERLDYLQERNAQGIILPQEQVRDAAPLEIPTVVTVGTTSAAAEANQLLCADEEIGRMGAETLQGLGLRHFAYCGLANEEFSGRRERGFTEALQQAGYSTDSYRSFSVGPHYSGHAERARLADWLRSLPKPAGVMACHDDRAAVVSETCARSGIPAPGKIAILGVNNDCRVCESATPPLSSIALATERGGFEAAALLDALMQGSDPPSRTVLVRPTHVATRMSTDTAAVDDPVMARALRFIWDNADRDIRVADLPGVSGLSRRALQDRFRNCLSRTPMEEIHRCRIARLSRLLVETDMSIREIAAVSGFDLDAHVSRFFSRHTGVSPLEFRRKTRAG